MTGGPGARTGRSPRWGRGVLAGLAVAAVVAVPAFWAAVFAMAGFSGCFIECSTPDPQVGLGWSTVAIALLSLPVVAGAAVARAGSRRSWLVIACVASALVVVVLLARRVV